MLTKQNKAKNKSKTNIPSKETKALVIGQNHQKLTHKQPNSQTTLPVFTVAVDELKRVSAMPVVQTQVASRLPQRAFAYPFTTIADGHHTQPPIAPGRPSQCSSRRTQRPAGRQSCSGSFGAVDLGGGKTARRRHHRSPPGVVWKRQLPLMGADIGSEKGGTQVVAEAAAAVERRPLLLQVPVSSILYRRWGWFGSWILATIKSIVHNDLFWCTKPFFFFMFQNFFFVLFWFSCAKQYRFFLFCPSCFSRVIFSLINK